MAVELKQHGVVEKWEQTDLGSICQVEKTVNALVGFALIQVAKVPVQNPLCPEVPQVSFGQIECWKVRPESQQGVNYTGELTYF